MPHSTSDAETECAAFGQAAVDAGNAVAAREWFEAASAAFKAAYELDVD